MPDEPQIDLEKLANADEKELAASLEKLKTQTTPPPAPEGVSDIVPSASAEESKPEEKAAGEVKPEIKSQEPKPEDQQQDGAAWRLLRQKDRELIELRRQMAERDKPAEIQKPQVPTYEDDPAEYLRRKAEATDAEVARLRFEKQESDRQDIIRRQEVEFSQEHQDYFKATQHLITSEVNEWQKSGLALAQMRTVLANPQFRPWLDQVKANPQIRQVAEQNGQDPDEVAAFVIARDSHLNLRQRQLSDAAAATGRSVADIAYELAKGRGYGAGTPANESRNSEADTARARVEHAKEISAATQSLSESGSAEGGSQPRMVRNRNQILNLNDKELDEMIEAGSYREL